MDHKRIAFSTHGFSVVVARHPHEPDKWLAVKESKGRGWWLPAGHVDRGQTFVAAAKAEALEEAGMDVDLIGLLAVEHTLTSDSHARMRVVFLGTPSDPSSSPKDWCDGESDGADWLTVPQLREMSDLPPPAGLRGRELLHWATYLEAGGAVAPVALLQEETEGPGPGLLALLRGEGGETEAAAKAEVPPPIHPPLGDPTRRLMDAIGTGNLSGVRRALLDGAEPDAAPPPKRWSALHRAVDSQSEEIVRALLVGGVDPNATTHRGRTPLHMSCARPAAAAAITGLLLLGGADPTAKDDEGKTAEDCLIVGDGDGEANPHRELLVRASPFQKPW